MAESQLKEYRAKRDFSRTAEPKGGRASPTGRRYLIQKHDATRLHFDFRLEEDGVLKSWAVTRGPSLDPKDKRLAVHVEDHPIDYGDFEGTIPEGEYGGGTVMLWDEGTWEPIGDAEEGLAGGELKFILHGERLKGRWVLVRMKPRPGEKSRHENWLLIKERDEFAKAEAKPLIERVLTSVRTGRTMDEIAAGDLEWTKQGARQKAGTPRRKRQRKPAAAAGEGDVDPPAFVSPQLATLVDASPAGDEWLHEIKYDGYRAIVAIGGGKATIYTRNGLDWTDKFAPLVRPLADLPCRSALLDGEIAVADADGHTDFGALQNAIGGERNGMGIYLFDLLSVDGEDWRDRPLVERKQRLAALLRGQPKEGPIFYSDHIVGKGAGVFKNACDLKLEGIVSKRADAPYVSGRSRTWLKVKCGMGQEFVIIGWRPSEVKGRPFSSILVGLREGDRLSYRGRVGSGFDEAGIARLWAEFKKRAVARPPVDDIPPEIRRDAHYIRPDLVAEIAFRGWTRDGLVRQGSFKGLRIDKPAKEVVPEIPKAVAAAAPAARRSSATEKKTMAKAKDPEDDAATDGVRLTHPDRLLFADAGVTKQVLADYYLAIADHILPHVAGRPLSIVRCPDGAAGQCFFQKHASKGFPAAFKSVRIAEKSGSDEYLYIADRAGLVAAVQMSALELHVWASRVESLEEPDRMVFDFDPDEGLDFRAVKDAAKEMRERLAAVGLASYLMASGGKGLHVVVPVASKSWEAFKNFAEAMARAMAADSPDRYLAKASKSDRAGRIFIDYLRNGRGATAVAPFSCRVRPGAPVAWPLAWEQLSRLKDARPANVLTAPSMIEKWRADPWEGYFDLRQTLPTDLA